MYFRLMHFLLKFLKDEPADDGKWAEETFVPPFSVSSRAADPVSLVPPNYTYMYLRLSDWPICTSIDTFADLNSNDGSLFSPTKKK